MQSSHVQSTYKQQSETPEYDVTTCLLFVQIQLVAGLNRLFNDCSPAVPGLTHASGEYPQT